MSRRSYLIAILALVVGWVPISVVVGIGVGHLFNDPGFGGFIGFSCFVGLTVPLGWLVTRALRKMSGCPHCGYSLHKNVSGVCPECGHDVEVGDDARSDAP